MLEEGRSQQGERSCGDGEQAGNVKVRGVMLVVLEEDGRQADIYQREWSHLDKMQ